VQTATNALTVADGALSFCRALHGARWTSPRPFGIGTTRTMVTALGLGVQTTFFRWEEGRRYSFSADGADPREALLEEVPNRFQRVAYDWVRLPMPVVAATPQTLRGYGNLVDDPAQCRIEIVRWPSIGSRRQLSSGWRAVILPLPR